MQDFKKLIVWQKAFQLIIDTYDKTVTFPSEERYGLTSQTKRAVVYISNNIAEGCGRFTQNDFAHFLQMSLGSTMEVENCFLICKALGYLNEDAFVLLDQQNTEIRKILISLNDKIRKGKP